MVTYLSQTLELRCIRNWNITLFSLARRKAQGTLYTPYGNLMTTMDFKPSLEKGSKEDIFEDSSKNVFMVSEDPTDTLRGCNSLF